jgi:hypothetical protein
MMYHLDPQTGDFLWRCPRCGESIRLRSQMEVYRAEQVGACEGCRAKVVFERNPELISLYIMLWARSDAWPQSVSWMEAIPPSGISILSHAYETCGMAGAKRAVAAGGSGC